MNRATAEQAAANFARGLNIPFYVIECEGGRGEYAVTQYRDTEGIVKAFLPPWKPPPLDIKEDRSVAQRMADGDL